MSFPGPRVLCVEDNAQLAEVTVSVLAQLGCAVDRAASAEKALERDLRSFDMVFSDVSMPGSFDGIDMARRVPSRRPGLPVVLTSGYMIAPGRLEHTGTFFLPKPYRVADLCSVLSRAIARIKYVAD